MSTEGAEPISRSEGSGRSLGDAACTLLVGLCLALLPPGGASLRAAGERPREAPGAALIRAAAPLAVLPPPPLPEPPPEPDGMVLVPGSGAVRSFWLDRAEVTAGAYAACAGCPQPPREAIVEGLLGPRERRGALVGKCNLLLLRQDPRRARHPMNCVTAAEARRYCAAQGKRLPTEAEWQLAAGGERERPYPWGAEAPGRRRGLCWQRAGSCQVGRSDGDITPEGVRDLGANVQEWVDYGAGGTARFRGGSWAASEEGGLAGRHRPGQVLRIERRQNTIGFRCARDLPDG